MRLDRTRMIGASGVIAFALFLGISSIKVDNTQMINQDNYGIHLSAGANAAFGDANKTVAGASGAIDASVDVVSVDNYVVGQSAAVYGYTNLGIAIVDGNLNIRDAANTSGSIVGKMTNYAACEILGEENGFYQIKSGNAEGYVSADYIVTGEEAVAIANQEVRNMATVTTDILRVREHATTESTVLSTVNKDEELVVIEVLDGWLKVEVDNSEGYVSADYVTTELKLKTGNTMKELTFGSGVSQTRVDLVNYALQFVGNRYVWGGESLTKGVDCSGFTMKIYQKYGIYLPHSSRAQPNHGTKISRSEIRPGDLIFYGNGKSINHVAIYMGNGQVVHASNARDGIKISNAFYRTPICIVSYLP